MLHINEITYRVEGRLLLDNASIAVPPRAKVGLVGRNGTGKSTLLNIMHGRLAADAGTITMPSTWRLGGIAQEAPGGENSLIDHVLAADKERARLMERAETETDPLEIAEIHTRLSDIDAHAAPSRAAAILAGLGFPEARQQEACGSLSGGWRMRVALAAALFDEPDVLLLDEPTNYLDLEGTIWLQSFLRNYRHTVVIVSHDRDLLNTAVSAILHLDDHKLTFYQGNYDTFERQRREQQALQLKLKKKQDDQRRHMQAFVDRFKAKASKARQAQSRLKALEKLEPISAMVDSHVAPFLFPSPERVLNPPLVRFEDASAGYVPGEDVLRGLDFRLDGDDRIGLLGANGNGKSTFAKILAGKMPLSHGHMRHHKRLEVGYFAQHQLDELKNDESPYDHIRELMPDSTEAQRRAKIGALGFGAHLADTKAGKLSGGEKARLLFAMASFSGPHILILDEPTNHLDVDSRQALIQAINDYEGTVILISHDRHLIETCADRLWLVGDGTISAFDGDLDDYTKLVLDSARDQRRAAKRNAKAFSSDSDSTSSDPTLDMSPTERRKLAAQARAELQPYKKKIQEIESNMQKVQDKIAELDVELAKPNLYKDNPGRAHDITRDHGQAKKEVTRLEAQWMAATEELEAAQNEAESAAQV